MAVQVKICGVTTVADARLAVAAGADLIGLNFYPHSPRAVAHVTAEAIRNALPGHVRCVGVFVNAPRERIAALAAGLPLDLIQFHGDESPAALSGWSAPTIRAVRVGPQAALPDLFASTPADYVLLDAHKSGRYGGTGATFTWQRAAALPRHALERTILAGGLTPDNVTDAVQTVRPWAVDVASGVESAPGRKDAGKLARFIRHAKAA